MIKGAPHLLKGLLKIKEKGRKEKEKEKSKNKRTEEREKILTVRYADFQYQ